MDIRETWWIYVKIKLWLSSIALCSMCVELLFCERFYCYLSNKDAQRISSFSSSSSCSFSLQGLPQQIICLHLALSLSSCSFTLTICMSFFSKSITFSEVFLFYSILAALFSTSFVQYIHYPTSVHVQTISILHL